MGRPRRDENGAGRPYADQQPVGGTLLAHLTKVFREKNWGFSKVAGLPVIVSELTGPLGSWTLSIQVVEGANLVLLYTICPFTIAAERRPGVSELLTRLNHGLTLGNFELDLTDGEVRFKTSLAVGNEGLSEALLERLIRASGRGMQAFLPAIEAVARGNDPEQVVRRCGRR